MSYQKKSIILQELEQAIRKKAQEKSRHKDQANKLLQGSVEKKKNVLKTTTNKDNRLSSMHKQSQAVLKQQHNPQPLSLFNNQQLNTIEAGEFKCRKYNNRRLDKLVSLIQYMISSSQKALKYISSTNFQAEFALKLYRSDKDNLLSELKNLTLEDILDSQRSYEKMPGKNDLNINTLLEENAKLKKDILVLQKEAQRFHKQSHGIIDDQSASITYRENEKLKEMMRKLIPFESYKQVVELLDKEGKFEAMSLKCQQNSKKTTEIEIVISSIEHERNSILENIVKNKQSRIQARSQRYRMGDIQEEKEQLQREIANLKTKLIDIKESSRTMAQLELLRRNSELTNERLAALANELSNSNSVSSGTRSSQQLIELIRSIALNYLTIHQQITTKVGDLQQECDILKRENLSFRKYRNQSEEEFNNNEKQMENMAAEIEKFKQIIDELDSDRERAMEHIKELELVIRQKQEDIENLHEKLNDINGEEKEKEELQLRIKEMKKQQQTLLRKWQDKQQFYRQKILKSEEIKNELQDKIMDMAEELQHQRNQLVDLARKNESIEDSRDLTYERMKIQYQSRQEDYVSRIHKLQTQNKEQQDHHASLKASYQTVLTNMDKLTHSNTEKNQLLQSLEAEIQSLHQKNKEMQIKLKHAKNQVDENLKEEITSLSEEIKQLNSELDRVIKQNTTLTEKLRSTQHEIISNSYANEEVITLRQQNTVLTKKIQSFEETQAKNNLSNAHLNQKIVQLEAEIEEKTNDYEELDEAHHKLKNDSKNHEAKLDQLKKELNQIALDNSFLTQEKNSLEKILEEQNIKYNNETQQLNRELEQLQKKFMIVNQTSQQYQLSLSAEKSRTESLNSTIETLQQTIQQLQEEIISLTHTSNELQAEKDSCAALLNILAEQKQKLQIQLANTKEQIQESSMINHSQKKQYVILLKQILKGIGLENDDFANCSSFEELLEFGSQQVVQMRKKQRDEESNRRKTKKEQDYYAYQYEEEYSGGKQSNPTLQDCKVQLFSMQKEHPKQPKTIEKHQQQKVDQDHDLNDFNEMHEEGLNDSMLSQQNKYAQQHPEQVESAKEDQDVDLDDFNDMKSEKLNDSAISNDREGPKTYEDLTEQEKRARFYQNLGNYKQVERQDLSKSENKDKSQESQEQAAKIEKDQNDLEEFNEIDNQINESMMSDAEIKGKQKNSLNSQEDDPFVVKNLSSLSQFNQILNNANNANDSVLVDHLNSLNSSPQKKNLSDFKELQQNPVNESAISNQEHKKSNMELNNLQDFEKVKSDQMNESVVSAYNIKKTTSDEAKEKLRDDLSQHSPVKNQHKVEQNQEEALDLDQFNELPVNPMNDSMMSDQGLSQFAAVEQDKLNESSRSEHGLSQFGEINQQNMTESMLSDKQHGLSQFGDIQQDEMNASMVSEKQQGLAEFSDIHHEEMNASMVSDKEHGLSDFGEMEDKMNDSVLSEQNRQPESKESELSEFDEYSPDKLNDSVLSQKMDS